MAINAEDNIELLIQPVVDKTTLANVSKQLSGLLEKQKKLEKEILEVEKERATGMKKSGRYLTGMREELAKISEQYRRQVMYANQLQQAASKSLSLTDRLTGMQGQRLKMSAATANEQARVNALLNKQLEQFTKVTASQKASLSNINKEYSTNERKVAQYKQLVKEMKQEEVISNSITKADTAGYKALQKKAAAIREAVRASKQQYTNGKLFEMRDSSVESYATSKHFDPNEFSVRKRLYDLQQKEMEQSVKQAAINKCRQITRKALNAIVEKSINTTNRLVRMAYHANTAENKRALTEEKLRLATLRKLAVNQKDYNQARLLTTEIKRVNAALEQQISLQSKATKVPNKKPSGKAGVTETSNGTAGFYDTMFGDAGTSFGHKIATTAQYAAAGTALYKLAEAFSEAGRAALAFDAIQYKIQFVLGASKTQAKGLAESFQNLAETYGSSIDEVNSVALALGRAGIANDKLAASTKEVIRLSMITGDSLDDTTNVVVSFDQVFGKAFKSTANLADALAWTANASRLSTQDLGTLSNYALSAAKTTGMTAESVLALSAAFSNAGVNASTIGTQIRKLSNMMKQSTTGVKNFFQTMGTSQGELLNEFQNGNATDAFKQFVNDISNMTQTQYNLATSGLNILERDAIDKIRTTNKEILSSLDTLNSKAIDGTTEAADKIALNYEQTIARVKNAFLSFSARKITGGLDAMFGGRTKKDIDNFIDSLGKLGHMIGVATAAFAAYKLTIKASSVATSTFSTTIALTEGKVISLTRAMRIMNVVLKKNPAMLAATAMAALGAAAYESYSIMSDIEAKREELLQKAVANYNKLEKAAEAANKAMYGDVQSAAETYTRKVDFTTNAIRNLELALKAAQEAGNKPAADTYQKSLDKMRTNLALLQSQLDGVRSAMTKTNVKNFAFVDRSQLDTVRAIQDTISKMVGDKQLNANKQQVTYIDTLIKKQREYIKDNQKVSFDGVGVKDAANSLVNLYKIKAETEHDPELTKYEKGKKLAIIQDQITAYSALLELEGDRNAALQKQIITENKLRDSKLKTLEVQDKAQASMESVGQRESAIHVANLAALAKQYDYINEIVDSKDKQLRLDALTQQMAKESVAYTKAKSKEERKDLLDKYKLQYTLAELDTQRNNAFQTKRSQHAETINFLMQQLKATEQIKNLEDRKAEQDRLNIAIRKELVADQQDYEKRGYLEIENILNHITASLESGFENFLDYASQDFLNFQKLASQVLHDIYMQMVKVTATQPFTESLPGVFGGIFGGATVSAKGNVFNTEGLSAYRNTIVDKPTAFAFATGGIPNLGIMGEKNGGSPEAIVPLTRTADGDLGVKTTGTQNVKIEIINESGQKMQVKDSKIQKGMDGMIISVVLDALATNRGGLRTAIRGQ